MMRRRRLFLSDACLCCVLLLVVRVSGLGLGAFHSGLEVYGTEYSFGAGGGVFSHSPKQADGARFRERVYLGDFHGGHRDVETVVGGMRGEWAGSTYNVLTR